MVHVCIHVVPGLPPTEKQKASEHMDTQNWT